MTERVLTGSQRHGPESLSLASTLAENQDQFRRQNFAHGGKADLQALKPNRSLDPNDAGEARTPGAEPGPRANAIGQDACP